MGGERPEQTAFRLRMNRQRGSERQEECEIHTPCVLGPERTGTRPNTRNEIVSRAIGHIMWQVNMLCGSIGFYEGHFGIVVDAPSSVGDAGAQGAPTSELV